jgi:hypothetical protein
MIGALIPCVTAEAVVPKDPMAEVIATRTEGRGIRPPGKGRIHTSDSGSDPDLWLYRDRTVAMLKRYLRLSIEVGRSSDVPSPPASIPPARFWAAGAARWAAGTRKRWTN